MGMKIFTKIVFYFSGYPENSVLQCYKQKVIGKDKTKVISIAEFGGLKSQLYSIIKKDDKGDKKAE